MSLENQQEIATPNKKVAKRSITKTIVYLAAMCALCVILKSIGNSMSIVIMPGLKLTPSYVGYMISAIVCGPFGGGLVAALSDPIGQLVMPDTRGAFNPFLLLGNGLATLAFGVIYHYVRFDKEDEKSAKLKILYRSIRIALGGVAFALVGTMGFNSFGLWVYWYRSVEYFAYLLTIRSPQLLVVAINVGVVIALSPALYRLKIEYKPTLFCRKNKTQIVNKNASQSEEFGRGKSTAITHRHDGENL